MKNRLLFLFLLAFAACRHSSERVDTAENPDMPVTEDEAYIDQAYIDSLDRNRKQNLVDLRRELGFDCVDLMDGEYINLKIKVFPDGHYEDVQVLDKEGIDVEPIRLCINAYFEKNKKLNLGMLKDLPGSAETRNRHPHVYTLLIY